MFGKNKTVDKKRQYTTLCRIDESPQIKKS